MADNYSFKDGGGTTLISRAKEVASGIYSNFVHLMVGSAEVDATNPLPVTGAIANPSANFNRPADTTTYASGELVANSTTAGSVTPMSFTVARVSGGSFMIRRVKLKKTSTTITNAVFRLHLYRTSPTCSNGDNAAWLTNDAGYLGAFDIAADRVFTDGSHGAAGFPINGSDMSVDLASGTVIYGLLEARAAYAPGNAETFTVELEVIQN